MLPCLGKKQGGCLYLQSGGGVCAAGVVVGAAVEWVQALNVSRLVHLVPFSLQFVFRA